MAKHIFPIGTVVLLKGAAKRVMICGRFQKRQGDDTLYDYSGCPFPEGLNRPSQMILFQNEDIAQLYFIGCQDQEELQYREALRRRLAELEADRGTGAGE